MRTFIALAMGAAWFLLLGLLAAAAPTMPDAQLACSIAALLADGLWLWTFIHYP